MQFILFLFGLVVIVYLVGSCSEDKPSPAEIAAAREQGFHCLSSWDGSHRGVVDAVKAQLRDPRSFEHISTRISKVENGRHSLIMEYRARNGFGGMNVGTAVATVDHYTCTPTVLAYE